MSLLRRQQKKLKKNTRIKLNVEKVKFKKYNIK